MIDTSKVGCEADTYGGRQVVPKDTPQDRTKLQLQKLQEERKQAHLELDRLREALKVEVDPDADEGDPDLVEREKVMALVQGLERKLESIEYALRQAQVNQSIQPAWRWCRKPRCASDANRSSSGSRGSERQRTNLDE
jgi:hypothetical protein